MRHQKCIPDTNLENISINSNIFTEFKSDIILSEHNFVKHLV